MNELIRIDKNVAHNVLDFTVFGKDKLLVKALIYYFCYAYQHDVFGYGTIDPYVFAKKFGFTPNYLRSRHPAPKQLEDKSEKQVKEMYDREKRDPEHRVFDSILENAMYLLRTTTMYFTKGGKTIEQDGDRRYLATVGEVKFLKEFQVRFKGSSKSSNQKVSYTYELDSRFVENLTEYYLKGDRETITRLRKPGLDDLYIYLKNLRDNLAEAGKFIGTPTFGLMCKLAHINDKEPRFRKNKLKKAMKRLMADSDLEIEEFRWAKGENSRYYYDPVIEFKPRFAGLVQRDDYIKEEKVNIFRQTLVHELLEKFKKKYPRYYKFGETEESKGYFIKWLKKGEHKDKAEKALAFQNAYFKTWNKAIESFDTPTVQFLRALPTIETLHDLVRLENRKTSAA